MAGHSKFKNIQHRKGAQDKKRAKLFTKLVREIITAAKIGNPDPNTNPRLRTAIIAARSQNLPRERIERAISSASEAGGSDNYVEMRYEGYAAGGIAIIVEALTDNKNRTASDVRSSFTKYGGSFGEQGSVSFMFDHCGIMQYSSEKVDYDEMLELAIEAGADDSISDESYHTIYSTIENFSNCLDYLFNKLGDPEESYIGWKPHNLVIIDDKEQAEKLLKMIDMLEDSDDVQRVFGNYEISDRVYGELN